MQERKLGGKQADQRLQVAQVVVCGLQFAVCTRGAAFRWLRSGRSLPFYFVTTCSPAEKRVACTGSSALGKLAGDLLFVAVIVIMPPYALLASFPVGKPNLAHRIRFHNRQPSEVITSPQWVLFPSHLSKQMASAVSTPGREQPPLHGSTRLF